MTRPGSANGPDPGGIITHLRTALLLGLLLPSGVQSQTVITQAQVDSWIREAHALLQVHGLGRGGLSLVVSANRAGVPLGLPEIENPAPPPNLPPQADGAFIDSLLVATSPAEGFATVRQLDGPYRETSVLMALGRQGRFTDVLDLALKVDSIALAARAVLHAGEYPMDERQAVVRGWLSGDSLSKAQKTQVRKAILLASLSATPAQVLEEVSREVDPEVRARTMLDWLSQNWGIVERKDSLLVAVGIDAAEMVQDQVAREEILQSYSDLCHFVEAYSNLEAYPLQPRSLTCDARRLPVSEGALRSLEADFRSLLYDAEMEPADSVLSIRVGLGGDGPHPLSLIAGVLLGGCSSATGCTTEFLPLRDEWIGRFENLAEGDGPQADTMRARLVELWAIDDAARALRWLKAVEDPELAARSGYRASRAAQATDFWGAVALLRARARAGSVPLTTVELVLGSGGVYVDLKRLGEDTLAEELISTGVSRSAGTSNRLAWVRRLAVNGRTDEARELALELLPDWDTETHRSLAYSLVPTFSELGILEELIQWVEEMPDGTAKATALLGLAEGARSLVVDPRSP